jgi:hypothetical protein
MKYFGMPILACVIAACLGNLFWDLLQIPDPHPLPVWMPPLWLGLLEFIGLIMAAPDKPYSNWVTIVFSGYIANLALMIPSSHWSIWLYLQRILVLIVGCGTIFILTMILCTIVRGPTTNTESSEVKPA